MKQLIMLRRPWIWYRHLSIQSSRYWFSRNPKLKAIDLNSLATSVNSKVAVARPKGSVWNSYTFILKAKRNICGSECVKERESKRPGNQYLWRIHSLVMMVHIENNILLHITDTSAWPSDHRQAPGYSKNSGWWGCPAYYFYSGHAH